MTPTTIPGFYIDERIGLTVTPGCAWNDKTGSRWRVGVVESPPPKSRLLAADPNDHPSTRVRGDWQPEYPVNDDKPAAEHADWSKGGAP